ncbi:unnamed protein product [Sympodiomycopsis kandeliae]
MASKQTRSDATERHKLHHPFETIKELVGAHHDHKEQRSEDKENQQSAVHFRSEPEQGRSGVRKEDQTETSKGSSSWDDRGQGREPDEPRDNHPDQSRAEDVARDFLGRSEERRTVRDPITHQLLENVRDVTKDEFEEGIDEAAKVDTTLFKPHESGPDGTKTSSKRWTATSALPAFPFRQDAPSSPAAQQRMSRLTDRIAKVLYVIIGCCVLPLWVSASSWLMVPVSLLLVLGAAPMLKHMIQRRVQDAFFELDAEAEDDRGEKIAQSHWPESAEWANKVLAEIWPAIQPEMFDSLRDTLEDLLQANVPSFLSEVKVANFTQGANPLRILSVALLPNTDWKQNDDKDKDSGARSKADEKDTLDSEVRQAEREAYQEADPEAEMMEEQRDPNDRYVNLSVTFAYRARSRKDGRKNKQFAMAEDIQMLLLLIAKFGPAALKLPVKVHLQGLVGTVRLRIHLIASPPFLGETLISFVSLPRVNLDVVPLKVLSLNDIRPLANFVQRSIDSAFASFTAPKSIKIDLASLISSDGVQRKINSIGVVIVRIHDVEGIERADLFGQSDPYALFSWSRTGKPVFSTRVILKELSPRFEESTAILVPVEIVKAKESIGLEIFDSDRSADDFLGKAEIELKELLGNPRRVFRRTDQLRGVRPGARRPGKATWSACFLPKAAFDCADLEENGQSTKEAERSSTSSDGNDQKKEDAKEKTEDLLPVERVPPSKYLPSGILCIQIHEIAALSNQSSLNVPSSTSRMSRNVVEGRVLPDEETTDDLADEAPNSYVEVIAEDKLVYRTRTKISDYRPIFNASTEKVILDWRTARVLLVVREKKFDEDDPILGIVPLTLADVFEGKSLSSGWHPISGGIGSGRIKISLLFQSVQLPQEVESGQGEDRKSISSAKSSEPLSPSSIGTLHIRDLRLSSEAHSDELEKWSKHSLTLRTLSSRSRISSKFAQILDKTDSQDACIAFTEQLSKSPALIPILRRGASPLMLRFDSKNSLGRTKVDAMAVLWLRDLTDGVSNGVEIPIWKLHDQRATQWLRQQYAVHHAYFRDRNLRDNIVPADLNATVIGKAVLDISFVPGVSSLHGRIKDPSGGLSNVCQAWKLAVSKGLIEERHGAQASGSSQMRTGAASGDSYGSKDEFYDATSSSSDEASDQGQDQDARSKRASLRSRRENLAQGKVRAMSDIASAPLDKIGSAVSYEDGVSSGSKFDLVRRFGRDVSDRQPIPQHYFEDSDTAEGQEAASGDVKPVRVIDSAVNAIKARGEKIVYSFDRKKGQKGGEGVEVEV